jgi:hypothetical protein
MDLDRDTLAKIDRRLLSRLGHHEGYQMVRVPVSEAMWSAWRRYCAALGGFDGPWHHCADRP